VNERTRPGAHGHQVVPADQRPTDGAVAGTAQPADPLTLVGEVAWHEFPLYELLKLANDTFKELLAPTRPEDATGIHHAKAAMLRIVLTEVLERAGKIYPIPPLACACGEVFQVIDDMDAHLGEAFVPDNDIGLDGKLHGELNRAWLLARPAKPDDEDDQGKDE
jgi:hypothetical protein